MILRTRSIRSSFVLLATLGLAAAPLARAAEGPDGLYFEGGGGAEYWDIPAVEGIIDPSLNEIGNTDGSFWADTAFLAIGFADGDGTRFPDPIGRNARIEARVRWIDGDSDNFVGTTNPLGFFQINNPPTGPNGSGPGFNTALYDTDLESWEAEILARTDVDFSDLLVLTPYVGLAYAYLDVENDFTILENDVDISRFFSLDDEIEAHFFGLVLGGDATFRPIEMVSLRLGVRADLMGVDADLEADQNFREGFTIRRNAETDDDADFAARVGASLGVGVKLGMFEVGVDGNVRYHSYMPTAEHPTNYTHRTSHVGNRSAWTGSVMGRLTIAIP